MSEKRFAVLVVLDGDKRRRIHLEDKEGLRLAYDALSARGCQMDLEVSATEDVVRRLTETAPTVV